MAELSEAEQKEVKDFIGRSRFQVDSECHCVIYVAPECPDSFLKIADKIKYNRDGVEYSFISDTEYHNKNIPHGFSNELLYAIRMAWARVDGLNHYIIYSPSQWKPSDVNRKIYLADTPDTFKFITEDDWANLHLVPSTEIDPGFFDEKYFLPGSKTGFGKPYTWENEKNASILRAKQIIDVFHPSSVLDCGCAFGFFLKALVLLGMKKEDVAGFDISKHAVSNAEPEIKDSVVQFTMDGKSAFPYPDNSFDVVSSDSTMEHIPEANVPHELREMARVSKKWVRICIPLGFKRDSHPWGDVSHKSFFPAAWWIKMAWDADLFYDWKMTQYTIVDIKGSDFCTEVATFAFCKGHIDMSPIIGFENKKLVVQPK